VHSIGRSEIEGIALLDVEQVVPAIDCRKINLNEVTNSLFTFNRELMGKVKYYQLAE
jgi:hypothetical protein